MAEFGVLKIQDLTPETIIGRYLAVIVSRSYVSPQWRLLYQVYQYLFANEVTSGDYDGKVQQGQGGGAVGGVPEVTNNGKLVDPGNKKQGDDGKANSGRVGRRRRHRGGVNRRARQDKKKAARESAVRD